MRIIPNPTTCTFDGFDVSVNGELAAVIRETPSEIMLYDYLAAGRVYKIFNTGHTNKDIISRPLFSPDGKYLFAVGFTYGERGVLYCWEVEGEFTPILVLPLDEDLDSGDFFVGEAQGKILVAVSQAHTRTIHITFDKQTLVTTQVIFGAKVHWLSKTGGKVYIPPGDTRSMMYAEFGGTGPSFKIPFCCEHARPVKSEAVLMLSLQEHAEDLLLTRVELDSGKRTVWNIQVATDEIFPAMALSDDGTKMLLVLSNELWFMPVPAPGDSSPIYPKRVLDLKQHIEWAVWSPDGLTVTVQGAQGLITVDVDE